MEIGHRLNESHQHSQIFVRQSSKNTSVRVWRIVLCIYSTVARVERGTRAVRRAKQNRTPASFKSNSSSSSSLLSSSCHLVRCSVPEVLPLPPLFNIGATKKPTTAFYRNPESLRMTTNLPYKINHHHPSPPPPPPPPS